MTATTVRILNCDHPRCDQQIPEKQAEGWTNAIYTHGCPEHGDLIIAHRATLGSQTRGRGHREITTWTLTCACGWAPRPNWANHNYGPLRAAHLTHLQLMAISPNPTGGGF